MDIRLFDRKLRIHCSGFPTFDWYVAPSNAMKWRKHVGATRSGGTDFRGGCWQIDRNGGLRSLRDVSISSKTCGIGRHILKVGDTMKFERVSVRETCFQKTSKMF